MTNSSNEDNLKKVTSDAPDLVEPLFDEASDKLSRELFGAVMPDLVKDLPVLKYAQSAKDIYTAFRIYKLRKRMTSFLQALIDGKFNIDDYLALLDEERQLVLDILVTELDSQTDNMQSEALALLFNAYIRKDIERLTFHGVAHELKGTNPLTFSFNTDGFNLRTIKAGTIVEGPLHYLPSSFYSSQTDVIQFSSMYFLTNLGEAFFTHVYYPMSKKHTL